ncbi:MAG: membrane protein of unknown function [Nitrospira sp.]|nr:MAG: membrane protein of unknown function [Nitrospira sp.]
MKSLQCEGGRAPNWAPVMFGWLCGWHVFLFGTFLIIIGCSASLYRFGENVKVGSLLFYAEVLVASILSGWTGIVLGKIATRWLSQQTAMLNYVCLAVAIILTVISFPNIYSFWTP